MIPKARLLLLLVVALVVATGLGTPVAVWLMLRSCEGPATPTLAGMRRQLGYAAPLGFAVLAGSGPILWMLAAVISFEYLGVGMGTAAFTAFIARETSKTFAATQFALFTALAALPRTFANASTGVIVEEAGWVNFFLLCALLAIPGTLLLIRGAPWRSNDDEGVVS